DAHLHAAEHLLAEGCDRAGHILDRTDQDFIPGHALYILGDSRGSKGEGGQDGEACAACVGDDASVYCHARLHRWNGKSCADRSCWETCDATAVGCLCSPA